MNFILGNFPMINSISLLFSPKQCKYIFILHHLIFKNCVDKDMRGKNPQFYIGLCVVEDI